MAELQKSIYNDYSEIEQLIRLSNHPSLVKTPNVEASAGAGSIIEIPEDMQSDLKPYIIQPSSQSLTGIMDNMKYPVQYLEENILMNTNVLKAAYESGVTRVLSCLSTCTFPDTVDNYPFTEKDILSGPPAKTNFLYFVAKGNNQHHFTTNERDHINAKNKFLKEVWDKY